MFGMCLLGTSLLFGQNKKTGNALVGESSPYLLQHAYNPVKWYPWGDEALQKAKEEDKLLIVSIGYAACHWCHVMEEESFQDTAIARFMNENFISVKVDREERPDIDQFYMNAFRLISEETGWPLNAIALPDGKPIYAVSYLNKAQWSKTLNIFSKGYAEQKEKLTQQAAMLTKGIKELNITATTDAKKSFELASAETVFNNIQNNFDPQFGGLQGAPKFPMPVLLNALLHYQHFSGESTAKALALKTLDQVALGGLYDHLAGGFARYSVDAQWQVPHFEKMLYDNALLCQVYTTAYQITGKPLYKEVVEQTLQFFMDEMTADNALFYSSLSAITDNEEGKFYVWQKEEIESLLGKNQSVFNAYFQVSAEGNWENRKNILRIHPDTYSEKISKDLSNAKALLLKHRNQRIRPEIDDKLLTAWNALMISALAKAYQVFEKDAYLLQAEKMAKFFQKRFEQEGQLLRNYKKGKIIPAFLEDYAYLIQANLDLYEANFNEQYLNQAKALSKFTEANFFDAKTNLFFQKQQTSNKAQDLLQGISLQDDIIPSGNSVMCKNWQRLGWYFDNKSFHEKAKAMLSVVEESLTSQSIAMANWLPSLLWELAEPNEVAIVGEDATTLAKTWNKSYHPNVVLFGGQEEGELPFMQFKLAEGKTSIYVCRNKICKKPVYEVQEARGLLK